MAYVDWKIKTRRLVVCNCHYGCPCEFNARPSFDYCEGMEAMEIVEGYFGAVRLDGLRVAGLYHWPGAVHEGNGTYQTIIDDRATDEQREALFTILSGGEQEPTTGFNIYASTIAVEPDPIFASIEFEWDIAARTGRARVTGVLDLRVEPIRNPVTGAPHQAAIRLPQGFEFREAEMASSTFKGEGALTQDHRERYGLLTVSTYGPYGVIDEESYPQAHG